MAKRRRSNTIDRQTLFLIITVFIVGIGIGLFFGKRAATVSKIAPARERVEETRETLRQKRSFFAPFFWGFAKKGPPKIAIVIDDVGNDDNLKDVLWSFPHTVTLAIIPKLPRSEYFSTEGKKHGFEIILHQPMEPIRPVGEDDATMIKVKMSDRDIAEILGSNLQSVASAVGMNNHMGSLATQDERVMQVVLSELKKRGLFFLDSLTTSRSVCRKAANVVKLPYLARDVFLDNEMEPDYIHGQIEQLAQTARKMGSAIGIGHYKWNTLVVLKEEIARLEAQGFQIVTLRDLL